MGKTNKLIPIEARMSKKYTHHQYKFGIPYQWLPHVSKPFAVLSFGLTKNLRLHSRLSLIDLTSIKMSFLPFNKSLNRIN